MIPMILISPPFGNYISLEGCTSVRGSYTYSRRRGLVKQIIKTLRPTKGGWRNSIGLRNKGISNIKRYDEDSIYSITALKPISKLYYHPWSILHSQIPRRISLELNIGCPNVSGISELKDHHIIDFVKKFDNIIVKVPPTFSLDDIARLYDLGITKFHLSNTLPMRDHNGNGYGVSGERLKEHNLPFVESTASFFKLKNTPVSIIAGGGIYKSEDVVDYYNAGATGYSLSTIFFTPWKVSEVLDTIKHLNQQQVG